MGSTSRFASLLENFFYRPDEEGADLLSLVPGVDELAAAQAEEPPQELLTFRLEDEWYAVPILSLREIVKVPPLTEVPRAEPELLGVMNLRGDVLPVYSIKRRLNLLEEIPQIAAPGSPPLPRSCRVLVVRSLSGDCGILVDAVADVVRLRPSTIEPPPTGLRGERECIVGFGRVRERLYILLDLEQVLS